MSPKLPPNNVEAEQSVLGALLVDPDAIFEVAHKLKPEHFFQPQHRTIYEAMLQVVADRRPVDYMTVYEQLRRTDKLKIVGGDDYLLALPERTPYSTHTQTHAEIVLEAATRRELIRAAGSVAEMAWNESRPLQDVLAATGAAIQSAARLDNKRMVSVRDSAVSVLEEAERRRAEGGTGLAGISTGLLDLDRLVRGMKDTELIVVAGRPSMGKTALMVQIAQAAAEQGHPAAFMSLEMAADDVTRRMVAAEAGMEYIAVKEGRFVDDAQWARFMGAAGKISELPLHIYDGALGVWNIESLCRQMVMQHNVKLIALDYLQIMGTRERGNRNVEVAEASIALKTIARELGVVMLVGSQLSRAVEQRQDKRPMQSDVRDSGQIEQDADQIWGLYRDEYYFPETTERPNIAELSVLKNRNGATGAVDLYWQARLMRFRNLERQEMAL